MKLLLSIHFVSFSFLSRPFFLPNRTALYLACISGHAAAVEALTEAGADPSTPDRHYWFPIHRATLWSHVLVMKALIKVGVDTNIEDEDGVFLGG